MKIKFRIEIEKSLTREIDSMIIESGNGEIIKEIGNLIKPNERKKINSIGDFGNINVDIINNEPALVTEIDCNFKKGFILDIFGIGLKIVNIVKSIMKLFEGFITKWLDNTKTETTSKDLDEFKVDVVDTL